MYGAHPMAVMATSKRTSVEKSRFRVLAVLVEDSKPCCYNSINGWALQSRFRDPRPHFQASRPINQRVCSCIGIEAKTRRIRVNYRSLLQLLTVHRLTIKDLVQTKHATIARSWTGCVLAVANRPPPWFNVCPALRIGRKARWSSGKMSKLSCLWRFALLCLAVLSERRTTCQVVPWHRPCIVHQDTLIKL